ncbi:MAG: autotransporter adhesin family protein [Kiritimatiellae bacterium]|nr:autotransporter adhesin family protein [Kiritimatiellia bacterium]
MKKMLLAVCGLIGAWTLDADTVINLNGGSQSGSFNGKGPITESYTIHGPGTFTSSGRVYPNNLSHIVTFDQGAVVWLTTHNSATDGFIVSGNKNCEARLGNCTVGSCRVESEVSLARCVTLVLTDTDVGASITTVNNVGTKITMQTNNKDTTVTGAGNLNLIGGGTFSFNPNTTFSYTGTTTVKDGTLVQVLTAVPNSDFFVTGAGTLQPSTAGSMKSITVQNGGILDAGAATRTFTTKTTFEAGGQLSLGWTSGNTPPVMTFEDVAWPEDGRVLISPSFATEPKDGVYPIVAGLGDQTARRFVLTIGRAGSKYLGLKADTGVLSLVVSTTPVPEDNIWTGGAAGPWDGLNWDFGQLFGAGGNAVFRTAGAQVTVPMTGIAVNDLVFDASATLVGNGRVDIAGTVSVAADQTARIETPYACASLQKDGAGRLELPTLPETFSIHHARGSLVLNGAADQTYTLGLPDGQVGEDLILHGPGTFLTTRLYPYPNTSQWTIDGGAEVFPTTTSSSGGTDGLMVGQNPVINLGVCTLGSGYSDTRDVAVGRCIYLNLTDAETGFTVRTENAAGESVTFYWHSVGSWFNDPFETRGTGRLNVGGTGTLVFNGDPTTPTPAKLKHTGGTVFQSGVTVKFQQPVEMGAVTVEPNASLVFEMLSGTENTAALKASAITWPETGTIPFKVFGSTALADGEYVLATGAGDIPVSRFAADLFILGKTLTLANRAGSLVLTVTTTIYDEQTWKGGDGGWGDADGWNGGHAWIPYGLAIFPVDTTGTVTLSGDVTASALTFLGDYTIAGSGRLSNASVPGEVCAQGNVMIGVPYETQSGLFVKTGAGTLTFADASWTMGVAPEIRAGRLTFTTPANFASPTGLTMYDGTSLDLGGGTLSWTNNMTIAGNIRWENGTFTKTNNDEFRPPAGTHLTLAKGGSITTMPGQRVFFDRGTSLTMEADAGTITCTSFGAGIDYTTENAVTIHGGAIRARNDHFRLAANTTKSVVTFLMDGGELADINQFRVGMSWTGTSKSSGSADVTIGGTAAITLNDGFYTGNAELALSNRGSAEVALHFDGGTITAKNGFVAYYCLGTNTVSFNGTTFRASAANTSFINVWDDEHRTVTIDEGGLILDSAGFDIAALLPFPGEGAIVKRGAGTLSISGATTATGGLRIEAGRLAFARTVYTASGDVTVSGGATLAVGTTSVTVPNTLTLAEGAVLGFTVNGSQVGTLRAQTVAQAGAVTIKVTPSNVPANGIYTLIDDLTGWDATKFQLAVVGTDPGLSLEVRGTRLVLVCGTLGAWKGGADAWSAADGWGGAVWTDGAMALFDAPGGSTVTVDGSYSIGSFAFLADATVAAGEGASLSLADGTLDVPAGVSATVTAPMVAATLVKRGEGTFTLGGTQPGAGTESVNVQAGTFNFADTLQGGRLVVGAGAKAAFAAGADVQFQSASIGPGETLVGPAEGTATVRLGTVEVGTSQPDVPALVVPKGLDMTADYLQSHVIQNTHAMTWLDNFGVRELVIDGRLTIVNGMALGFTGCDCMEYRVNGTGTLRLPSLLVRTDDTQSYGPLRLEFTGADVTPKGVCGYDGGATGFYMFDGTTLAGAGVDWYWHTDSEALRGFTVREGGLTIDTTDADDGETARRLVIGGSKAVVIDGPGDITVIGNGTFGIGWPSTLMTTGEVRVRGASTFEYASFALKPLVRLEDAGARLLLTGVEAPSKRVQARAVACAGSRIETTQVAVATFSTLELAAGAALRVNADNSYGVGRFDLRGAEVAYPAEGKVNFEVAAVENLPAGRYPVLSYDTIDPEKINPVVVGETTMTSHFEFEDATHRLVFVVDGSDVEPASNIWCGEAEEGLWSKALNWKYTASPIEGKALIFEGASGLTNRNDTGVAFFPTLTFQDSRSATCGAFDIDLALTAELAGPNPVTSSATTMQVVRGYASSGNFRKKGSGDVMFVDPDVRGYFVQDAGSPITFYASEDNTVSLNSDNGNASKGSVHYTGPGTFRHNTRFYPNAAAYPITVDGGATVWVKTHNSVSDGLIVAQGTDRKVRLGDCSVGSLFPNTTIQLQRSVGIEFTDATKGTTLLTDNVDGTPITLTTSNEGLFSGNGRVNIGGHGIFTFNANANVKFTYTGPTFVNADATAEVYRTMDTTAFTVGGVLNVCAGGDVRVVTVAEGGVLKTTGGAVGQVTAQTGATLEFMNDAGIPVPFGFGTGLIVAPAEAKSVVLACAETALPLGRDLPLTVGANLQNGDEKKFKLEFTGKLRSTRLFVKDGELWAHVNTSCTIYLR